MDKIQQAIDKLMEDRDSSVQKFTEKIDALRAAQKALKAAGLGETRTYTRRASAPESTNGKPSIRDPKRAANVITRMRECFKPGEWFTTPELGAVAHEDIGYIRYKVTRPMVLTGELEAEGQLNGRKYRIPA